MIISFRKLYKILLLPVFVLLILSVLFFSIGENVISNKIDNTKTIIIDAGHGGMDSGASSAQGLRESDLNLDIALKLKELLTISGYNVIMTREDTGSADGGFKFIKKNDVNHRIKIANKYSDVLFISIHMNSFSDEKYSGAQMFYDNDGKGRALAQKIQASFKTIQADNTRDVKIVPPDVMLFKRIKNPVVLAECGFLSNTHEAELLSTDEYRTKVALIILAGI